MLRYSEVIGLPVICATDGKRLGVIKDIVFCPKDKKVVAFLVERKGYEILKKVVFMKDIQSMGKDALIINSPKDIKDLKKVQDSNELKEKGDILGLRVCTRSGEDVGVAKDVLLDFTHGKIDGIEVSGGLIQDILEGRNILPLIGKVEFGEEYILVDSESIEEMMETGGGIKNIIEGKKRFQERGDFDAK
ncbi:MAG TPA: PRC-barrel domain-containing protein [Acetivibrio sp.]|nr:PRC-barrel domain-containing protein [Acetivibrio sp.]